MSSDRTDWDQEGDFPDRPFGTKPFGTKPFGTKPFGTKPFGTKPFGTKPFGTKPLGLDESGGFLEPDEWSADVAELVCERSAVIRLGATLVAAEHELRVPRFRSAAGFSAAAKDPGPGRMTDEEVLRPRDSILSVGVAVPRRLLGAVAASAELTYTLKVDLAEALAGRADQTFLQGKGGNEPKGIAKLVRRKKSAKNSLETARALLSRLRQRGAVPFRRPGWALAASTLDGLTKLVPADQYELLRPDGIDGGMFLGYPFVTLEGAEPGIYFAADWQEAWIAVTQDFVSVEVTAEPAPDDAVVIRAWMPVDFRLRRPAVFAWAKTA